MEKIFDDDVHYIYENLFPLSQIVYFDTNAILSEALPKLTVNPKHSDNDVQKPGH